MEQLQPVLAAGDRIGQPLVDGQVGGDASAAATLAALGVGTVSRHSSATRPTL